MGNDFGNEDILENSYSNVYKNEELGTIDLNLNSWPTNRYQASVFFAGDGKNVLDVGCGNGIVLYNLRKKFENLFGIELSSARVFTAQKTLKGLNANVYKCNIERGTDFEAEFFDTIICSDVIEHLLDVFGALDEINRILKSGGKLILNTPNVACVTGRFKLLSGKFPSTSAPNEGLDVRTKDELLDGGHLNYFTFSMLKKMLEKYYSKIEFYGFGPYGKLHNLYPSLLSISCQIVATK